MPQFYDMVSTSEEAPKNEQKGGTLRCQWKINFTFSFYSLASGTQMWSWPSPSSTSPSRVDLRHSSRARASHLPSVVPISSPLPRRPPSPPSTSPGDFRRISWRKRPVFWQVVSPGSSSQTLCLRPPLSYAVRWALVPSKHDNPGSCRWAACWVPSSWRRAQAGFERPCTLALLPWASPFPPCLPQVYSTNELRQSGWGKSFLFRLLVVGWASGFDRKSRRRCLSWSKLWLAHLSTHRSANHFRANIFKSSSQLGLCSSLGLGASVSSISA